MSHYNALQLIIMVNSVDNKGRIYLYFVVMFVNVYCSQKNKKQKVKTVRRENWSKINK